MGWRRALFGVLYRLGFIPWDGHPLAPILRELVEGNGDSSGLPAGTALDIGCGTGDSAVYLALHGWQVTGVDFVPAALVKARAKAAEAQVSIDFVRADATRLRAAGVGAGFTLIVDNGCLHGMSDTDRDEYVREVANVSAPNARLLIIGFPTGGSFGVRGIELAEIERRFVPHWVLLAAGEEPEMTGDGNHPRHYLLQRRP